MKNSICKRCGKPLSVHESVERGIGPICVNKIDTDLQPDNQVQLFGNSFIHNFKGFGGCKSQCQVDILEDAGTKIVVFTDIGIGTSVTNYSEHIATDIVRMLGLDPLTTLFVERYRPGKPDQTIDQIEYTWDGSRFRSPKWRPLSGLSQLTLPVSMQA